LIANLEPETESRAPLIPDSIVRRGVFSILPRLLACRASRQVYGSKDEAIPRRLILEDGDASKVPGQMTKTEFLTQLRRAVASSAATATAGTMWADMDCPYIDRWFDYYSAQSAHRIERAVRQFAPEARNAASAREYILIVSARVGRSISKWSSLG
jgi:hypothetical protein